MLCFSLAAWVCGQARAGDWEITPFLGYQFGGDFEEVETGTDFELEQDLSFGLIADFDLDPENQVELYFGRQETELTADGGEGLFDVDVNYLHIGGVHLWDQSKLKPFIVGTLGLTHFDFDKSDTRFSLALGGGVKVMPNERFGFRFEGRGFATFVDSSWAAVCGEGCRVYYESDVFLQFQVSAGVVFRF